ncbi:MAG TPA: DUF6152 family protein [Gammaproteobacteria bacterium]|nr:DUF6152 family protein [Gammaproteobacteria bacterium]
MKRTRMLVAAAFGLILAIGAEAHHSFTATYDESKEVRIEGTLVAFHFRNPHASVDLLAENENGEMVRWGIEWGGAGQLSGQGVTRESLRAGDHVIITGNPSRNPELHRLRMQSLLRPSDGYGWGFEGETFD